MNLNVSPNIATPLLEPPFTNGYDAFLIKTGLERCFCDGAIPLEKLSAIYAITPNRFVVGPLRTF